MDATLTIRVRILGAQAARELRAMERELQRVAAAGGAGGAGGAAAHAAQVGLLTRAYDKLRRTAVGTWNGVVTAWKDGTNKFNRTIRSLDRTGQSLRRSGQQITFGFTIPFAIAGGAAMKWALDNERAMTMVEKVYGDYTYTAQRVKAETEELKRTFELMSSIFGVHQSDVIDIGAAWAATGLAGEDLANATRATLEAMMIGEMDAERTTAALISIMASWRLATDRNKEGFSELTDALAILNSVENATGARFADLVDAFDRAGGAARQAGVSIEELAALVATLVPTTGSGAAAGNAIKTLISRIMAPWDATEEVLNEIGIITRDPEWMGATATQKIERMAKEFVKLDQATRNVVTSTVAGRWQLNRFDVMMADIASGTGFYAKALDAASDATRRQGDYLKELNAIMDSNPKRFDILVNVIKNELSEAMIQFIPIVLGVLSIVGKLAQGFNNLPPGVKSFIMVLITGIAVLGPVLMLLGVLVTSFKNLFMVLKFGRGVLAVVQFLFGTIVNGVVLALPYIGLLGRALLGYAKMAVTALVAPTGWLMRNIALFPTWAGVQLISLRTAAAGWLQWVRTIPTAIGVAWLSMTRWLSLLPTWVGVQLINIQAAVRAWAVGFAKGVSGAIMGGAKALAGWLSLLKTWVAIQWLSFRQALVPVVRWAAGVASYMATAIGHFALTAAAAARQAAATGLAWLTSALPGVVSAVTGIATSMLQAASFYTYAATVAMRSAMATASAWLRVAATGVVNAVAVMVRALVGLLAPAFTAVGGAVAAAAAAIGIPVWALVAIVALVAGAIVALFNDDIRGAIVDAVKWIGRAIWGLPDVFARALSALLRVVATAVQKVWEWLSYLNPFQRHSPSLVDNVRAGVRTILDEYARLRGISRLVGAAASAHQRFQNAVAGAKGRFRAIETAKQRQQVAKYAPQGLAAFDEMVGLRDALERSLIPLTQEIDRQAMVVARLESAYNLLDRAVESSRRTLDAYERQLDAVNRQMDAAEEALDRWSNMGITGMRAMEDEIFANEMAQKRLRLAIMDLEDAGGSVDNLRDRFARLNGEIELMRGERQDLYLAGAGSDILSVYDAQIAALEEQRDSIGGAADEINEMAKELERLERIGQRLDLEKSITFDPQLRQIQQLADGLEEMPFDVIIANVRKHKAEVDAIRPVQERLNALVDRQRLSLDAIEAKRDAIKYKLDAEQDRLSELRSAYDDIKSLISDMEAEMSGFASAAERAASALKGSKGDEGRLDGIFGDYDIAGGTGMFDTKSTLAGIEELNRALEDELARIMSDMPDPFATIRKKWGDFLNWVKEGPVGDIAGWIGRNFSVHGLANVGNEVLAFFQNLGSGIVSALGRAWRWIVETFRPIWQPIYNVAKTIWDGVYAVVSTVMGLIINVVRFAWGVVTQVFSWAWGVIQPILQALWDFFYTYIFPVFQLLWGIVKIVFTLIWRLIEFVVTKVLLPVLGALVWAVTHVGFIFSWLWGSVVKPVWNWISGAISWAWEKVISPALSAIWGFVRDKVGPIFKWLWNEVIKPVWNWISDKVSTVWNETLKPAFQAIRNFIRDKLGPVFTDLKDTAVNAFNKIKDIAKTSGEKFANFFIRGVNLVIKAFNTLARGVTWVGDKLGIKITINTIPEIEPLKLAKGGIVPTDPEGGLYAGVRAIVGEGSNVWPEYVIPTDPRYRSRAQVLAQAAAERVGILAKGGTVGKGSHDDSIWGRITSTAKDVIGKGADLVAGFGRAAARLALKPIEAAAMALVRGLPPILQGFVKAPIRMIKDWINKTEPVIKGDPDTLRGWKGRPGSYMALIRYMQQTGVPHRVSSTIRPGATTRGSGGKRMSLHAVGRAVDFVGPRPSVDSPELLAIYRAFLPVRNLLSELIYSGPGGSNPSNPITRADHHNHVHVGLMRGGIAGARIYDFANGGSFHVPRTGDGILARIGEGLYDEKVQITPLRGNEGDGGGDTFNFYGDLSFPNITSADDAEEFIENLKALAQ